MARKDDVHTNLTAKDKTGKAFKGAQDNMRNLASSAAILEGPLGKVAGRINTLGAALGRMNPLAIAGGVAFSTFLVGAKSAITASADLEVQMARLNAVLKVTGREGEISAEQINVLSQSLGEATLTSAEAARDASAAILAFGNIRTRDLERVLKLSQSLSVLMGGDLRANAIKLARAIDNPREGLSGLSRNILASSPAWREMIGDMSDAGDQAGVAAAVFERLDEKLSGIGGAGGGGLNFAIDTLSERWTRLLQNMGGTTTVTSTVTAAATELKLLNAFLETGMTTADLFGEVIERTSQNVIGLGESLGIINAETEDALKLKASGLFEGFVPEKTISDLDTITWALRRQSMELGQLQMVLDSAKARGVDQADGYRIIAENADGLTASINALVNAQIRLTTETSKGPGPDVIATILKDAQTQLDQFTKKAQDKRDKAETAFEAMTTRLVFIGAAGVAKLEQLRLAYSEYLFKLDQEDIDKAQKKADKAVSIEEKKIERLKAVLLREQAVRNFDEPGTVGSLPMEREAARHQLLLDGLALRDEALRAAGVSEVEIYRLLQEEKTLIDGQHEEKRRQIAENAAQQKQDLEMSVVDNAVGLLNVLGQKSKAAAIISLAVTKGLAIAQVLARSQEASILAYSSQLIPGDPTSIARAEAARDYTLGLGYASATIIGATGLAQAAGAGGGGGGSGGSGGSGGVGPTPIVQEEVSRQQVIINNYGAITSEEFVVEVANAIQAGSDADIISIDVQGVTAEVRTV